MEHLFIKSLRSTRVKALVRLKESRERRRLGRFIIEGKRELLRALESSFCIEQLYYAREFFRDREEEEVLKKASLQGAEVIRLAKRVFERCSYREGPDGLLAVGQARTESLDDLPRTSCPLYLVVEGIEKPGNLGALIRTADAVGVDAVIVTDRVIDLFNPNVIRASQGSLFNVFVAVADRDECLRKFRSLELRIMASSPESPKPYWRADFQQPVALVMGSEKEGISGFWMGRADERIAIPMRGISDSLNVSVAAAIILFEAVRQRNFKDQPGDLKDFRTDL